MSDTVTYGKLCVQLGSLLKIQFCYGFLRSPDFNHYYQFVRENGPEEVWSVSLPIIAGATFSARMVNADGLVTSALYSCSTESPIKWKLVSSVPWSRPAASITGDQLVLQLALLSEEARAELLADVAAAFCMSCGTVKLFNKRCNCKRDE